MADQYHATGQVIDSETGQGMPGLRVEAWDAGLAFKEPFATSRTEEDGRFSLKLDPSNRTSQTIPDILFKVYRGEQLLEGAESAISWNAHTEEDVTIIIRQVPSSRINAKDRLTTKQFLKAFDFVDKSDFSGVFRCFTDNIGTRWDVLKDVVGNTVSGINLEPVQPGRSLEKAVIGNNLEVVKQNLEAEKITVNEVLAYNPRLNQNMLSSLTTAPACLKAGQRVNLYEQNGTVKYYTVVKESGTRVAGIQPGGGEQPVEIKKLEEELKFSKEDALRKEEQIIKLQQELLSIRQEQLEMKKVFKSPGFEALLKKLDAAGGEEKPVTDNT